MRKAKLGGKLGQQCETSQFSRHEEHEPLHEPIFFQALVREALHQTIKLRRYGVVRRRAAAEAGMLAGAGEHYFLVIEVVRHCAHMHRARRC